ncbi:MAG: hypothetical protein HY912_11265 [Desulfomonile tiedjei]|uniref:Uncharacterized protein n=1 Tax=Desulfomonile tiedjei TaxID=2358 RepID=A0A9D6Z0L3_9BACT|nr:hypothetical protein [Desulfomonile tiedjei]
MDYKSIDGPVYSRHAMSPPIINSEMATRFGIKAPCLVEPGQYAGIEVGGNVKLRLLVDHGTKRITCHGVVDWIKTDEATGKSYVGFGSLSLSEEEFYVLERNFVEETEETVEFVPKVREKATEAESVIVADIAHEIMRYKAVHFPVSVIEAIDVMRGDVPFSEFVVNAVRQYIKQ